MIVRQGKPVCPGIAIGKVWVYQKNNGTISSEPAQNPEKEWKRFVDAKTKADGQLEQLYNKTVKELDEEHAEIFDVHRMMLEDLDYIEAIEALIKDDGKNAAWAVQKTGKQFSDAFASMDDDYMKERATDVLDISNRLVSILTGVQTEVKLDYPAIIVADDLTPSETVQLDKNKILAFVTRQGSSNSHTAILARNMDIPSIVQVDIPIQGTMNGQTMIVDGFNGMCYLAPDEELIAKMKEKQEEEKNQRRQLEAMRGLESVTKLGKKINLYANIGEPGDIASVLNGDAEGVGLFRSEFLYIGRDRLPTEEEQFLAYKAVAEGLKGKKVIIRTMDVGADKKANYLKLEKEENPALGYRAIRICLNDEELFKTQLRAIYRASAYGNVAIMFPMITSVWEVEKCKEISQAVKEDLKNENIAVGNVELGIMIETPAAVMISDDLAKKVDFFSVGTNDLTQYTLAVDRQNEKLDSFYNPHHSAILSMLNLIAQNAKKNGIWAGICGELGADPELTETFINMGYEELSVSPGRILQLRQIIRECNV